MKPNKKMSGEVVDPLDGLYRAAVDQHSIVSVTDVKGDILHANDLFCEISGYSRDELIGQNHRIVKSDEHSPEVFKHMWREIANGRVWRGEVKNLKKGGGFYWVKASIMPFLNALGKPHRYISIRTDITERKQAEAELVLARNKIAAALQVKTDFLSRMNHEIRTPLNGIIGMVEVLEDMGLNEDQRECLGVIQQSSENLMHLLLNLLDMENASAQRSGTTQQVENMVNYCRDLGARWGNAAKSKGIEFELKLSPDVPAALLFDVTRIDRIMDELLKNAFDFTHAGIVSAHISMRDGERIHTEVIDTGVGIPANALDVVFKPFEQADISTTRKFDGAGLGLALCKELVDNMGGQIGVTSNVGQGSQFWFELPIVRAQSKEIPAR